MKKAVIKASTGLVCIVALLLAYTHITPQEKLPELTLHNIEALASNEYPTDIFCYGIGTIDCLGKKVAEKITYMKVVDNRK